MAFSFDLAVIFNQERRRMKKRRSKKIRRRRRRRDVCKISQKPTHEIPFELVFEILTRLPAKSLMRFKSVSKIWSSLICSKYFTNRFLNFSSSPPRLYMCLGIDNSDVILSSSASSDSDGNTISSFVVDQDLTIPALEGYNVSHVFRGLMCFTNEDSAQIYNTSTRQLVVLPDIEESNIIAENHESKRIMYCIGHDPVHDQYKVVCTVSTSRNQTFLLEYWVLVLGGDVSSRYWRKIPSPCPPHRPITQGLIINGRMRYIAWSRLLDPVLVSFDMISEEISLLQKPEDAFWSYCGTDIIEYGGRVAVLHNSSLEDEGVMELYVMEDEEKNRWSRKTLVLDTCQMNLVRTHIVNDMSLRVQGTTSNGEVILVPQNIYYTPRGKSFVKPQFTTLFYIFLYDFQNNHLRKVDIKDTSNRYPTKIWDVIGFDDFDNLMYLL
ncbi:hypothetical protein EUTSA_v10025237mg [Eutrema salsugineum]|uniref:F-box domain-containing protein n=1 Tax=Eutrema salsugineum TaxID=72664 RepID=V4LXG3_EUTSA|nr:F-box protein At4g19940 [Eutrema salsugineum]ESQ55375.1 hypothetical protein EUTSA_v10025237mg [Eutrema salsugineum]